LLRVNWSSDRKVGKLAGNSREADCGVFVSRGSSSSVSIRVGIARGGWLIGEERVTPGILGSLQGLVGKASAFDIQKIIFQYKI
jgi:hypothetical protein